MLKVIELFSGIGSQTQALKNIGVEHEVVATSDIDKFADQSYKALHGWVNNMGDIRGIAELPKADLWTYSFPCQDISVAGKQQGFDKGGGTRSGLLWEVERLLLKAKQTDTLPKYLLLENVKNLIGKQHKANYETWVAFLMSLGYTTYTKVLNAKNYGVPQNRERVFGVSILGEHKPYEFPKSQELTLRLKDILDDVVDEKFYIGDAKIHSMLSSTFTQRRELIQSGDSISQALLTRDYKEPKCVVVGEVSGGKWDRSIEINRRVFDPQGLSPTITGNGGGMQEKKIIIDDTYKNRDARLYDESSPALRSERAGLKVVAMRGRNPDNPSDRTAGIETEQRLEPRADDITNTITTVQKDNLLMFNPYNKAEIKNIAPTQTASCGSTTSSAAVMSFDGIRVRKLTPTECWRLMGWKDEQINKVKAAKISNCQLYRQAGNGIVVNVLEAIFKNLFDK